MLRLKRAIKTIFPYLILSIVIICWWRLATLTDKYAWAPRGKELLMLDIHLSIIFIYKVLLWLAVGNIALFTFINCYNKKITISLLGASVVALLYFLAGHWVNKELAFSYFVVFRNQSVSEEFIERPILEAGYCIGGELTEYIQDKSVEYRRYAISGLGKIRYEPATLTLRNILFNADESREIRADALAALQSIGTTETEKIVREFERNVDRGAIAPASSRTADKANPHHRILTRRQRGFYRNISATILA